MEIEILYIPATGQEARASLATIRAKKGRMICSGHDSFTNIT